MLGFATLHPTYSSSLTVGWARQTPQFPQYWGLGGNVALILGVTGQGYAIIVKGERLEFPQFLQDIDRESLF